VKDNNMNLIPVFVYGSLKKGFGNNSFLSNSEFLGKFNTKESYFNMISLGGFPGVFKMQNSTMKISGELYLVNPNILMSLDRLESNGSFYTREIIELDNCNIKPFMYLLNQPENYKNNRNGRISFESGIATWI